MCTNNALFLKVPMSKWVSVCVLPEVHCTFEKHHCHISRDILNLWFDISLRRFVTSYGFEHKLNLNISGTGEDISKQKERKGHSSSPWTTFQIGVNYFSLQMHFRLPAVTFWIVERAQEEWTSGGAWGRGFPPVSSRLFLLALCEALSTIQKGAASSLNVL